MSDGPEIKQEDTALHSQAPDTPATENNEKLLKENESSDSSSSNSVWAFRISIMSAVISLFSMGWSGLNFYFATYKHAAVELTVSSQMLLSSSPRIGGWLVLANNGALPTTITSATLSWDSPQATFDAALTSRALDEWYFDDKGERNVAAPTHFSLFAPITLPGRSDTNTILWFTSSKKDFKFDAGTHVLTIAVFDGTKKLAERQIELNLTKADVRALDPLTELPVDVKVK
jgi:hypothetical protein